MSQPIGTAFLPASEKGKVCTRQHRGKGRVAGGWYGGREGVFLVREGWSGSRSGVRLGAGWSIPLLDPKPCPGPASFAQG